MTKELPERIFEIRDRIQKVIDPEKIILFGSYAYGTPREDSDYDFYVVLRDDYPDKPIIALQTIYRNLAYDKMIVPVDVLANYKTRFEVRSKLLTIERKIANEGLVLYERN
jgi:predicted nucleotidyltransferase